MPFHLVSRSPWPLLCSFQLFNLMFALVEWFKSMGTSWLYPFTQEILMMVLAYMWWRDITREASFEGMHTSQVVTGLKLGMCLFITSEVFFFFAFFWAYFHTSISPDILIGQDWPCAGIQPFNPMGIPLLNTLILVSSGVTLTASHHFMMTGMLKNSKNYLLLTILLGIFFTIMQGIEYMEATFSISDSVYGSIFFMATGFHGLHVIIGTAFLSVCYFRMNLQHNSSIHHFGFEAAIWYWHFVDVVWLFLYITVYCMGK